MIDLYCTITGDTQWNRHPVQPGALALIAPVYGRKDEFKKPARVSVPAGTKVMQDSGAFSDVSHQRLSIEAAFDRQIAHAHLFNYWHQMIYMCSYDELIDEMKIDGVHKKYRWTESEAARAVEVTVAAAHYLSSQRHQLPMPLVLSAQGVTPAQYLSCTARVIEEMDTNDVLGLGGWCVLGLRQWDKSLQSCFDETLRCVIPYAAKHGVTRAHIFGVIYPAALGKLLHIADEYGIRISTDSAGVHKKPCFGDWGYGDPELGGWRDNTYQRHEPATRGLERARHVELTRAWLTGLRNTAYYTPPPMTERKPYQLSLFGDAA